MGAGLKPGSGTVTGRSPDVSSVPGLQQQRANTARSFLPLKNRLSTHSLSFSSSVFCSGEHPQRETYQPNRFVRVPGYPRHHGGGGILPLLIFLNRRFPLCTFCPNTHLPASPQPTVCFLPLKPLELSLYPFCNRCGPKPRTRVQRAQSAGLEPASFREGITGTRSSTLRSVG